MAKGNTEYHYFEGKVKWARVREDQAKAFEGDDRGKFCSVNFYFSNANEQKAFKLLKTRKQFKIDDEGEEFIEFRRYLHNSVSESLGGPPKVIDKDKKEFEGNIGNGSKVTIKISTYPSQAGKATRLEGLRIEELVVYNPEDREEQDNEDRPF